METYLGHISGGAPVGRSDDGVVVAVAQYEPLDPSQLLRHYSTIGLSKVGQNAGAAHGNVHSELVMSSSNPELSSQLGAILAQVTSEALERSRFPALGDVVGPRGRIFEGYDMEAIYVRKPDNLPMEFSRFHTGDEDVQILWLVPITKNEAKYIGEQGATAFEHLIEQSRSDFNDVGRRPLL